MTEEESIIVRAAKILMAPPTPEPTSPAPTSPGPEGASFGSFFLKSSLITAAVLVAMNWEAITSFWVVTQ